MVTSTSPEINTKELAVIESVSFNNLSSQREIANRLGISLGLVNIIIKRLIKKGYLKASQLNRKKIRYMLTPKGFTEKAKKSYHFTLKTISAIKSIKQSITEIIQQEIDAGNTIFRLKGSGELFEISEVVLQNITKKNRKIKYYVLPCYKSTTHDNVFLMTGKQNNKIDIFKKLTAKNYTLISETRSTL